MHTQNYQSRSSREHQRIDSVNSDSCSYSLAWSRWEEKKTSHFSQIEPANGVITSHGIYCGSRVEEVGINPVSMSPEAAFSQWHLRMRRFTALALVSTINQHDEWMMKVDRGQRFFNRQASCASHVSAMSRMLKTASRWRDEFQVAIAAKSLLPSPFVVRFEVHTERFHTKKKLPNHDRIFFFRFPSPGTPSTHHPGKY